MIINSLNAKSSLDGVFSGWKGFIYEIFDEETLIIVIYKSVRKYDIWYQPFKLK